MKTSFVVALLSGACLLLSGAVVEADGRVEIGQRQHGVEESGDKRSLETTDAAPKQIAVDLRKILDGFAAQKPAGK
ncbi:hypothetical protein BBJ28_00002252 [Nothophytophthora sp. Chile5]|nr:hypothetical protein BBJ28_00002252 [Nothophytophthora sp. Chile5]